MSLETEKTLIATTLLTAFNKQFGTAYTPNNVDVLFNRPNEEMSANIVIASKVTNDNFRIRADIRELGNITSFAPFQLKAKVNYGAGGLNDEIYVTYGSLFAEDFKAFANYLKSEEFKTFVATPRRILTKSGNYIRAKSVDLPIRTQR